MARIGVIRVQWDGTYQGVVKIRDMIDASGRNADRSFVAIAFGPERLSVFDWTTKPVDLTPGDWLVLRPDGSLGVIEAELDEGPQEGGGLPWPEEAKIDPVRPAFYGVDFSRGEDHTALAFGYAASVNQEEETLPAPVADRVMINVADNGGFVVTIEYQTDGGGYASEDLVFTETAEMLDYLEDTLTP